MPLRNIYSTYMIGIGGIGMSALARYFNHIGIAVQGFDKTPSALTDQLQNEGIEVFFHESIDRIPKDVDLVVYTPAIPDEHIELVYYTQSDIPVMKRAEVLGKITDSEHCMAVAGSHGKSTTSAMLAHLFKNAGKNCTAFLGAIANNYQSNFIPGRDACFVVEADEFDRSFHQLSPNDVIITAVDSDHLDVYGSISGIEDSFLEFISNTDENGRILIQKDVALKNRINHSNIYTYGLDSGADFSATDIKVKDGTYNFDIVSKHGCIENCTLNMGGRYNVENAVAAIALALLHNLAEHKIKEALNSFSGLKRRFEYVFKNDRVIYIDDYAHHPTEISSLIKSVKELYPGRKVTAVFQPHLYSRTKDYAREFGVSLMGADEVVIMDIYPAREDPIEGVTADLISQHVDITNKYRASHADISTLIEALNIDVLLTIGAGDIDRQVKNLAKVLENKYVTKDVSVIDNEDS